MRRCDVFCGLFQITRPYVIRSRHLTSLYHRESVNKQKHNLNKGSFHTATGCMWKYSSLPCQKLSSLYVLIEGSIIGFEVDIDPRFGRVTRKEVAASSSQKIGKKHPKRSRGRFYSSRFHLGVSHKLFVCFRGSVAFFVCESLWPQ